MFFPSKNKYWARRRCWEPGGCGAVSAVGGGTALSAHGAPAAAVAEAPCGPGPGAATLALLASLPRSHHG